jgi:hypothetical protein
MSRLCQALDLHVDPMFTNVFEALVYVQTWRYL